ncbi:MAG: hypothetical protein H0T75_17960 [Rhizobiales bacterium]|nr:hypothetical protein [Hyphomicrobiales bacterium]
MRKFIIHAGLHKTGTTAIQMFCIENREALLDLGYLYPKSGTNKGGNHGGLIKSIVDETRRERFDDAKADFLAEIKSHPDATVVISAEYLEAYLARRARRRQILNFFLKLTNQIQIVVYIRPAPAQLNSSFVQVVKAFRSHLSFQDFVEARADHIGGKYLQLMQVADPPQVEATFLPYNDEVRRCGIVSHFLKTIGLSSGQIATLPPERRVNESIGPIAVAVANELLSQHVASGSPPSDRQRAELRKTLAALIAKEAPEPPFQGMHAEFIQKIAASSSRDQEKFARSIWGRKWSEVFAGDDAKKYNAFHLATADMKTAEQYHRMKDALGAAAEAVMANERLARPLALREARKGKSARSLGPEGAILPRRDRAAKAVGRRRQASRERE